MGDPSVARWRDREARDNSFNAPDHFGAFMARRVAVGAGAIPAQASGEYARFNPALDAQGRYVHLATFRLLFIFDSVCHTLIMTFSSNPPDTTSKAHNDAIFNALLQEGVIEGLYNAVRVGCARETRERYSRSEIRKLAERRRGDERWHMVDEELVHVGARYKFHEHWIPTGLGGHPEMLQLRRGDLAISAHQVERRDQSPRPAIHREEMLPILGGQLEYSLEDIERSVLGPPSELWYVTYERTADAHPRFIQFGRQLKGQDRLFYQRDVMVELGIVHPAEAFPDFNPPVERPATPFSLPAADQQRREGEGD